MHVADRDTVTGQHVVRHQHRQPIQGVNGDRLPAQLSHRGDRGMSRDHHFLHPGPARTRGRQRVQLDRARGLSGQVGGPLALVNVHRPVDQVRDGVHAAGDRHDLDVQPGGSEIAPLLGDVQPGRADGRDHRHRQVRFSTALLPPLVLALLLPHPAAATTAAVKVNAARARRMRFLADDAGAWRGAAGLDILGSPLHGLCGGSGGRADLW